MIYKILFLLSILATDVSFALSVYDAGDSVKLIAEGITVLLFVCAIVKNLNYRTRNVNVIRVWITALCLIPVLALLVPDGFSKIALGDFRELFIPFAITYSAFHLLKLKEKDIKIGMILIGFVSIFTAIFILVNTGGFEIETIYRDEVAKNQTAPYFAAVGTICLALGFSGKKNVFFLSYFIIIFLVCLGYCMILRARTATLVMLAITLIILYKNYHTKLLIIVPVLAIVLGPLCADQIEVFFSDSIVGEADASDMDDLTNGRTGRMEQSGEFILSHPLTGALSQSGESFNIWMGRYPIVHNYLMWKLVKYGFIFALPFILVYFSVLKSAFRMFRASWGKYKYAIICVLVAFITSLSEYSAPFGPGTSFILSYSIYGAYLYKFNERSVSIKR